MTQTDATGSAATLRSKVDIRYDEAGTWPLIRRHLLNILLIVVSLGLYRFWAITVMRRLLWRRTKVGGQALEYTGTGLEIFIGFVKVFLIVLLPLGVSFTVVEMVLDREAIGVDGPASKIVGFVYVVILLMLIETGRFLSWRYRVSRTRWRGLRGRIELPVRQYLGVALGSAAAIVFSGWLLKPVVDLTRARCVINALNIGGLKGEYTGGLAALMLIWVAAWAGGVLLTLTAIGVGKSWLETIESAGTIMVTLVLGAMVVAWVFAYVFAIYRVAFWRYVCKHAKVGPASIRFTGTATDMASLTYWNWMILVFSLGLLAPITWERKIRYLSKHVAIFGLPDPSDLRQVEEDSNAVGGEGLAGDFDIA